MQQATEKAVYYDVNLEGKLFDVLKRNADGTVDIGTGDKVAVRCCQISKFAKPGCASIGPDLAPPEPPNTAKVREATPDEIREEMRTNLRAANDWWQAKTLIEHRLAEQTDIARRFENVAEFRALQQAPAATA